MNFTFTKYLLTTVALFSTAYSASTITSNPLGGGAFR